MLTNVSLNLFKKLVKMERKRSKNLSTLHFINPLLPHHFSAQNLMWRSKTFLEQRFAYLFILTVHLVPQTS